jgi:hypothetical protein
MGVLATVAGSAVVVEFLFNRSDPLVALRREIRARRAALERLFQLYATHAEAEWIEKQSAIVRRYAVTGVGQLQLLLERVSKDKACEAAESRRLRAITAALDRLLILGAAFAVHNDSETVDLVR